MKQSAPYAIIGLGVILMAGIAWWFGFREKEEVPAPAMPAPQIELSEGLSIYTSGEHGFLLAYPEGAEVSETFDAPRLPSRWSVSAPTDGEPLLALATYRVQHEAAYPRDYAVYLRVGKSADETDVRTCTEPRNGETALADRSIGGTSWSAFSYQDAAMMQYVEAKSYRTVYEGACWALEALRTGSSYREDPGQPAVPDETLLAEYERLETVIESFRFAR